MFYFVFNIIMLFMWLFVYQELTDVDILHESEEGADALIDALLNQQVCALLVQNLERLDETVREEADGVHNTLGRDWFMFSCNSCFYFQLICVFVCVCFLFVLESYCKDQFCLAYNQDHEMFTDPKFQINI